ncbi:putative lipid-binding protein AIR1B [Brachypodium distachyon]|uniref:Hydrophobic seed protein domain-containing protein n=1 Tax=Brachypodium distachyon TaxID=15368 RepID=I1J2I1_BRADI|nr:putative lipid-binding protein AIR1B [Brachypodium distachyon]KQJ84924.1 hypothetical protein BRADI_5g23780v3 [Brachypodium distachyon]|eukprot:XP_003580669.1 putative lipid-binding protein AIR1B [Brachypodium distachyon]
MASRSGTAVLALLLAAATLSAAAYPAADPFCPWDSGIKFSACAAALGLVGAQAGSQLIGSTKCCELVSGLAAAEAAACLCVSAKESVLGVVSAEWSVGVELLASACSKELPDGFKCV